jgi:hypothetical protein
MKTVMLKTVMTHRGEDAVRLYGVCDCERATMLNQSWIIADPEFYRDEQIEWTRYIICGVCGNLRGDGASEGLMTMEVGSVG